MKTIEEFKLSVYGDNYVGNDSAQDKVTEASKKRKAIMDNAIKESAKYDWADLADKGKVGKMLSILHFTCMLPI